MKVLLIGGSGILSSEVCYQALNKGHEVYIINRGMRKYMIDSKAKLIIADVRKDDLESIQKAIKGLYFDVVADFLSLEVKHLQKHLEIVKKQCRQYILISSATVYAKKSESEIITEKTALGNKNWSYAYNKYLCEEYLRQKAANLGLEFTIVRPYVTYGKTRIPYALIPDGSYWTLANRIKLGKPVVIWDSGKNICTLTNTKDFAVGFVGLFLNRKAYGEDFHITSDYTYTWMDVLKIIGENLNCQPLVIDMKTQEIMDFLHEYKGVLTGDKATNMRFDNAKIKSVVPEFNAAIDFPNGIKETIEYFENQPAIRGIDYSWEGRMDWMIQKEIRRKNIKIDCKKILTLKSYTEKITFQNKMKYTLSRHFVTRKLYSIMCRIGILFNNLNK